MSRSADEGAAAVQSKKERGGGWALAAIVVGPVAVLLVLYGGAYFCLVRPEDYLVEDGLTAYEEALPEYPPRWQKQCEAVFAPAHKLDRWLRPATWYKRPYNPNPPGISN